MSILTLSLRRVRDLPAWVSACAVTALAAVPASAAEGDYSLDLSSAQQAVTEMKTKITSFFSSDLLQAILAVLGSGIVLWLLYLAWKHFKKAGQKAG